MLVVISKEYYPTDDEEDSLVMREYGFDEFYRRRSSRVL